MHLSIAIHQSPSLRIYPHAYRHPFLFIPVYIYYSISVYLLLFISVYSKKVQKSSQLNQKSNDYTVFLKVFKSLNLKKDVISFLIEQRTFQNFISIIKIFGARKISSWIPTYLEPILVYLLYTNTEYKEGKTNSITHTRYRIFIHIIYIPVVLQGKNTQTRPMQCDDYHCNNGQGDLSSNPR